MAKEKEITSAAFSELEMVTLNEAFQIVHNNELYMIEADGKTWLNDSMTLANLSEKMNKIMEKVKAAQPAMIVE